MHATPLLQPVEAVFDDFTAPVELPVENRRAAAGTAAPESVGDLVRALGDGVGDLCCRSQVRIAFEL
ncbi:hypothetical protein AB0L71_23375 [Streptomyces sp. NPDC052052]|uniref:hypothetical protein n=1 Tax=Streptomyces sp. NPDC052052 TaxID=3154756 RepID=UPI0034173166